MGELTEAVGTLFAVPAAELVEYLPDPNIEAIFGRYPHLSTPSAEAAGFMSDGSIGRLVERSIEP